MSAREVRHFFELIGLLGGWLAELEERQKAASASGSGPI
jgi:hypothetical protein